MTVASAGTSSMIDILPPELQRAQQAISKPDVIAMMKALAGYGLGVCMPHASTRIEACGQAGGLSW